MDNRKSEILDVTRKLINEKGLQDTSTNDIARTVGISRGTLYHHFESKEAILDALVEQISAGIYEQAREIAEKKSIPVIERLLKTVLSLNLSNTSDHAVLEHLNSPSNLILHQKVQKEMLITLPGIFSKIIEDGNQEGIFKTEYPYECMEMLVSYVSMVLDGSLIEMNEQESLKRLIALMCNMERMLGAEEGSFHPFVEAIAHGSKAKQ
jgi:AcrR family transcriptional regulator